MAKLTKLVLVVLAALLLASVATVVFVLAARGGGAATHSPERTASSVAGSSPSVTDARASLLPVSERRVAEHEAMLAAIASAREVRNHRGTAPTMGAPTSAGSDSTATTLDLVDNSGDTSEWAKRTLGTLDVLLGQCEDLGRAEDANLSGTITVQFTLVGEPNVGGLLESVQIVDADTTITQQTLRDCLTQQLYALELVPPPDGVTIRREIHLQIPD